MLLRGLVAIAVARLVEQWQRTQPLQLQFALAGVQFGHFDQVAHQVVQLFCLVAGRGHQLGLQRLKLPPNPWPSA